MQSVPLVERHVGTKHNSSLLGSDPPDVVPDQLGEPDLAVWTGRDAPGLARGRGNRELGDSTAGGDPPDLIPRGLGEPDLAVGTEGDAERRTARGGERELGDGAHF